MASPRDQLERGTSTAGDQVRSSHDRGISSQLGATVDYFVRLSDFVNKATVAVAMVILVVMLFIAIWGVVARFVLQSSLSWNEEADSYLFIWLTFLGAAVGYKERGHPSVMILVRLAPIGLQRVLLVLAHSVVIALSGILCVFGVRLIDAVGAATASSFDMPMAYAYMALPVGSAILVLHALASVIQDIEHPTLETFAGGE